MREFVFRFIERAYAAAGDPGLWPSFVESIVEATDSVAGGFHVHDSLAGFGNVDVNVGGDPSYIRAYREHYAALNPWIRSHGQAVKAGDVVVGLAQRDLVGSEYYEDFWAPQGYFDSLSAYVLEEASLRGALIVARRKGDPAFDAKSVQLFRVLTPHLQQAIGLQRRLQRVDGTARALAASLDLLPYGAILVDDGGELVFANAAGRSVLDRRDGLRLEGRRLCVSRDCARQFARLLGQAIEASLGRGLSAGGTLQIPRTRSGSSLSVVVAPVGAAVGLFERRRPAVIIFLSDPDERVHPDPEHLRHLYGLTPAEIKIALLLAQGLSVDALSEALHVSTNTVRTHLKRIFDKTGTQRQGDLVSLLLSSVAIARPADASRQ